jgi:hypothetical protein
MHKHFTCEFRAAQRANMNKGPMPARGDHTKCRIFWADNKDFLHDYNSCAHAKRSQEATAARRAKRGPSATPPAGAQVAQ